MKSLNILVVAAPLTLLALAGPAGAAPMVRAFHVLRPLRPAVHLRLSHPRPGLPGGRPLHRADRFHRRVAVGAAGFAFGAGGAPYDDAGPSYPPDAAPPAPEIPIVETVPVGSPCIRPLVIELRAPHRSGRRLPHVVYGTPLRCPRPGA